MKPSCAQDLRVGKVTLEWRWPIRARAIGAAARRRPRRSRAGRLGRGRVTRDGCQPPGLLRIRALWGVSVANRVADWTGYGGEGTAPLAPTDGARIDPLSLLNRMEYDRSARPPQLS